MLHLVLHIIFTEMFHFLPIYKRESKFGALNNNGARKQQNSEKQVNTKNMIIYIKLLNWLKTK